MQKNIDYEFKAKVLDSDAVHDVRAFNKATYLNYKGIQSDNTISMKTAWNIYDDYHETEMGERVWNEAIKIAHANHKQRQRLKKRIRTMLETSKCVFVTLTFKPSKYDDYNTQDRRLWVVRYLKSLNVPYVANIDFGKKNGREHYHCIVQSDNIDYSCWNKTYGGVKGLKVITDNSEQALANYIVKLTNHALKQTTKRHALIYSR